MNLDPTWGRSRGIGAARQHKLSPEAVRAIRASRDAVGVLARRYGVHPYTIAKVRNRSLWGWVE